VPQTARAAARATSIAFIAGGFQFANWASRIPQVRDRLHLGPSELGLLLLCVAAGSVLALPASGPLIAHVGSRRTLEMTAALSGSGLVVVAVGYRIGVAPVALGLFLFGAGAGAWDVAMNVQGAAVERLTGRAIMSRFHAGFSIGTVAGALLGALMIALAVPVTAHLLVIGLVSAVGVPLAARGFVDDQHDAEEPAAGPRASLSAWRERRTLLIGLFVLAFALAEGAAADWISVAMIDGHGAAAAVGTLAFATFLASMTTGRWLGPGLLGRYGRVPLNRTLGLLAIAGLALFAYGASVAVAFAGAVLWGTGVSLGFPVGMSAAADEPTLAAPRVGVVSSIGYCAFLGGPPLIGFLGQHFTVLHALTAVIAVLALANLITGSVRPPDARAV
jgi:MFS family permease